MKPKLAVVVPLLVTVMMDARLCAPCRVVGNVSEVVLKVRAAVAMPVPESVVLALPTLEVMLNAPESAPVVCGRNETMAVQLLFAGRLAVQVSRVVKDVVFVPVKEMPVMAMAEAVVLLMVTTCPGLTLPTFVGAKVREAGVMVRGPAVPVPVPEIEMVCGEPAALSLIVMAAVNAPVMVGAK